MCPRPLIGVTLLLLRKHHPPTDPLNKESDIPAEDDGPWMEFGEFVVSRRVLLNIFSVISHKNGIRIES